MVFSRLVGPDGAFKGSGGADGDNGIKPKGSLHEIEESESLDMLKSPLTRKENTIKKTHNNIKSGSCSRAEKTNKQTKLISNASSRRSWKEINLCHAPTYNTIKRRYFKLAIQVFCLNRATFKGFFTMRATKLCKETKNSICHAAGTKQSALFNERFRENITKLF
ncbi:hypothetical protein CEXT_575601 [Caerostris extrusa]|uniref:Uncharacterized protein n=1 Tax=Caerostris extrusa TaxID=172846 RepID=A0AAV4XSW6_CAEEX|nr:hypothetical protein CEXT_575601 [Caerostris extrusa]